MGMPYFLHTVQGRHDAEFAVLSMPDTVPRSYVHSKNIVHRAGPPERSGAITQPRLEPRDSDSAYRAPTGD